MELKEFNDMALSFVDHEFPLRDIPLIFNHSLKLQINEIDNDRHYKMQFFEFLEGFCRIVDKASPPPLGSKPVRDIINQDEWNMTKRSEQHLSVKLENLISTLPKLIRNAEFKQVKDKLPPPTKEESTGLFKFDGNNPFYLNLHVPKSICN